MLVVPFRNKTCSLKYFVSPRSRSRLAGVRENANGAALYANTKKAHHGDLLIDHCTFLVKLPTAAPCLPRPGKATFQEERTRKLSSAAERRRADLLLDGNAAGSSSSCCPKTFAGTASHGQRE